jgi:hypothetical protein
MMALGVLSIFQMIFLPGFLALKLTKARFTPFQMVVFSFGLSLLANFWLVFVMSLLKVYIRPVVLFVVAGEITALLVLSRRWLSQPLSASGQGLLACLENSFSRFRSWWENTLAEGRKQPASFVLKASLILIFTYTTFLAIQWSVQIWITNLGTVFASWDAVLSWNPWAVTWANNSIPQGTQLYPQLIPAVWSLSYVITGSTAIQFFAKSIMPLFFLLIVCVMVKLAWNRRSYGILIGIFFFRYMLKKFLGDYIAEGYVDIPVAALTFLAFYAIMEAQRARDWLSARKFWLVGIAVAAAATLTKQAGVFILLLLPVFAALMPYDQFKVERKERLKLVGWLLIVALLLAGPWNLIKAIQIQAGVDDTNVAYLTSEMHDRIPPLLRILPALHSLEKYLLVVGLALAGLFLLPRFLALVDLTLGLSYLLIWAAYFSYDIRNIAVALPFLAIFAGMAVEKIIALCLTWLERLRLKRLVVLPAGWLGVFFLALAIVGAGFWITRDQLSARQESLQKEIFAPRFNAALYDYSKDWNGAQLIRIVSKYPLGKLPGLEDMQVSFWFDDPVVYQNLIQDESVNHLLLVGKAFSDEITADIQARLESGEYRVVLDSAEYGGMTLIRIR